VFLTEVREFSLGAVGTIMAAYLVAMLAAEVPTGYLADRIGRRTSLAVGNAMAASAMVGWTVLDTPAQYVALNAVWATGTTFRSGTASALLYELLDAHDAADEFAHVSGRATTVHLVASAGSAVLAGVLVTVDWSLPFLANAAVAAVGLPVVATLPSSNGGANAESAEPAFRVRDALRMLRVQLARPDVRWFVAYAAAFYGVFQLGMAFEQPALRAVHVPLTALGVLYAAFKLVSAGAAATTGWLRTHLGVRGTFGLAAPVMGATFAAVAVWPLAVVPALFVGRALHALMRPLRDQYLNDRLEDVGRATVLSGASMALSLVAAVLDVVGGAVAEATGPVDFLAGAGVAEQYGVAALLWLTVSPVREPPTGTGGDGEPAAAPTD